MTSGILQNICLVLNLKAKVISFVRDYAWWWGIDIRIWGNLFPNFLMHSVKDGEDISVRICVVYIEKCVSLIFFRVS